MSQYPVLTDDGMQDGINYLLSGPQGLGQYYAGFSTSTPAFLIGSNQTPYVTNSYIKSATGDYGSTLLNVNSNAYIETDMYVNGIGIPDNAKVVGISSSIISISQPLYGNVSGNISFSNPANLNIGPLSLSSSTQIDNYTNKFTLAVPNTTYFTIGQPVTVSNVSVAGYNTTYTPLGVQAPISTFSVTAYTSQSNSTLANGTGGNISFITTNSTDSSLKFKSTDCIANAQATSSTDRVFLSGKLNCTTKFSLTSGDTDTTVTFSINRYKLILTPNGNSANSLSRTYTYIYDQTVMQDYKKVSANISNNSFNFDENFPSVVDQPSIGSYQYRIDLAFNTFPSSGTAVINTCQLFSRSLSAIVVKQ